MCFGRIMDAFIISFIIGCINAAQCSPGEGPPYPGGPCQPCVHATYQHVADKCTQCPDGHTTENTGSTLESNCILCPAGTYVFTSFVYNDEWGTCKPCPYNQYKMEGELFCSNCSEGHTTDRTGATSPSDCTVCPAGTYVFTSFVYNDEWGTCKPCPYKQYKVEGELFCSNCSEGHTTDTTGATSPSECTAPVTDESTTQYVPVTVDNDTQPVPTTNRLSVDTSTTQHITDTTNASTNQTVDVTNERSATSTTTTTQEPATATTPQEPVTAASKSNWFAKNTAFIAGPGAAAVVIVTVVVIICCINRRRRNANKHNDAVHNDGMTNGVSNSHAASTGDDIALSSVHSPEYNYIVPTKAGSRGCPDGRDTDISLDEESGNYNVACFGPSVQNPLSSQKCGDGINEQSADLQANHEYDRFNLNDVGVKPIQFRNHDSDYDHTFGSSVTDTNVDNYSHVNQLNIDCADDTPANGYSHVVKAMETALKPSDDQDTQSPIYVQVNKPRGPQS